MTSFIDIILSGLFHAAVLFLLAGGLQLVFGVQKIVNLACGAFYALGAYFGITLVSMAIKFGMPTYGLILVLIVAGLLMGLVGPIIERLLRLVYDREEGFQLLLTFAIMLLLEDLIRMIWGATPMTLGNLSMAYGQLNFASTSIPTYKVLVIGAEIFSRILDFNDRTTCVLFGDGAGAVVLEAADEPGILAAALHADGRQRAILCVPGRAIAGGIEGTPFLKTIVRLS